MSFGGFNMGSHLRTVARGRRALSVAVVVAMLVVSFAPAAVAMPRGDRTTSAPTVSAETVASTTTSEFTSLYQVAQQIGLVGSAAETQVPTGDGVQIALIDTGVVDVPGLRTSNVMIGPDFSFEDQAKALRGRDGNGHGTHLAGIMVGTDAAWKVGDTTRTPDRNLGIAPDAELVSIKVAAANGAVDVTQVIAAINWVIEHKDDQGMNIRVLALAYGTDSSQPYLVSPLAYAVERAWHAGIVVVVAAGNEGRSDWMLKNPATDPYVIAVGSVEQTADGYESS
ncbi:MAG: S8 family serine peptidase, partial [Acidimicrobiia bacterium]|nr:S8 family serine peptidase [Acidimicrobiia bacterium]